MYIYSNVQQQQVSHLAQESLIAICPILSSTYNKLTQPRNKHIQTRLHVPRQCSQCICKRIESKSFKKHSPNVADPSPSPNGAIRTIPHTQKNTLPLPASSPITPLKSHQKRLSAPISATISAAVLVFDMHTRTNTTETLNKMSSWALTYLPAYLLTYLPTVRSADSAASYDLSGHNNRVFH